MTIAGFNSDQTVFYDDRVLFGTNIPSEINVCLQQAVASYADSDTAERLLWQAQRIDPDQLETYVALYKFYFYKNRLEEAQAVVMQSLSKSAELGGFTADWNLLTPASVNWFSLDNPSRLYLYALKALSFIRLRHNDVQGAENILNKLRELDPTDQVGGSVLERLMEAVREVD